MNIVKTPQQKLLEEAGATPATPGMVKTPQQLLLEEAGITPPGFSEGGQAEQISPENMLAMMVALGYEPQKFANGGGVLGTNYQPTYNPEATFQPQDRSSYTLRTRDKIAEILARLANNQSWAEKTADELFGTGSGGMEPNVGYNIPANIIKGTAQVFNPLPVATNIMDLPRNVAETTRAEGPGWGALEYASTMVGALPYIGSSLRNIKKLAPKFSKKTKE